ncbi:MAG: hypothetical protein Fur0042_31030 [Cyanophyceae cyanobacterium]
MSPDASLAIARQTYAAAQQCRSLKARARLFVEAIAPLMDFDAIDAIAQQEGRWLRQTYPNIDTLGTKLSSAGYYKNLRTLLLSAGKNAELVDRHDATGQIIGTKLQHRALRWIGLTPEEWDRRNGTARILERLTPQHHKYPIDPLQYLTVADQLLDATRWSEIAAALVAATGRRPVEVIARGQFKVGPGDRLQFIGQAKKRGQTPQLTIAPLLPAERVVAAVARLRATPAVAKVLAECGDDNGAVDRRCNASINRAVRNHFSEVLAPRQMGPRSRVNCQGLRAAYAVLVVQRDCPEASPAEAMLYAARQLGHFVEEDTPNDRDLLHLLTTLGYTDYQVAGPVPHWPVAAATGAIAPKEPASETAAQVAIAAADYGWLRRQCEIWQCEETAAIARLVAFYQTHHPAEGDIEPKPAPEPFAPAPETAETTALAAQVARNAAAIATITQQLTDLQRAIATLQPPADRAPSTKAKNSSPSPPTAAPKAPESPLDHQHLFGLGNHKLSRTHAASQARIDRCVRAIMAWNDQNDRKWAINGRAIRDLMPCTIAPSLVSQWLRDRADWIEEHHRRHGIHNPTYYNRTHRKQGLAAQIRTDVWPLVETLGDLT